MQKRLSQAERTEREAIARPVIREYARRRSMLAAGDAQAHGQSGNVVAGDVPSALASLSLSAQIGIRSTSEPLPISPTRQWLVDVDLALQACDRGAAALEVAQAARRMEIRPEVLRIERVISSVLVLRLNGRPKSDAVSFGHIAHVVNARSLYGVSITGDELRVIYDAAISRFADELRTRGISHEVRASDDTARRQSAQPGDAALIRCGQTIDRQRARLAQRIARRRRREHPDRHRVAASAAGVTSVAAL
jgi:hypothetical protein